MDIDQLKNLLRKFNLKPNFTYGQNFLVDDSVLEDIVDAAQISSDDNILEIGPGIGNLTRALCEKAGFVLSIEKDSKFFPILKSIKKDYKKNFRFEIADALEYDFQAFFYSLQMPSADERQGLKIKDKGYKVVANIPYYITGKILQMLFNAKFKPSSITILTQKEVAERVTAVPGDLSVLAISAQIFSKPKIVRLAPAKSFFPVPKVDSAILHFELLQNPKVEPSQEKTFFKVVKACFAGKRKQIHNTMVNNLHMDKHRVQEILSELKINPAARPQELTIEQWIELSKLI